MLFVLVLVLYVIIRKVLLSLEIWLLAGDLSKCDFHTWKPASPPCQSVLANSCEIDSTLDSIRRALDAVGGCRRTWVSNYFRPPPSPYYSQQVICHRRVIEVRNRYPTYSISCSRALWSSSVVMALKMLLEMIFQKGSWVLILQKAPTI